MKHAKLTQKYESATSLCVIILVGYTIYIARNIAELNCI